MDFEKKFKERFRKRKTGAYQTCGKRLSRKKGAKARRLEKLLNQHDVKIEEIKLNEWMNDEISKNKCAENLVQNLEVLVISSTGNSAENIDGELKGSNKEQYELIKLEEEYFEFDAGPYFDDRKVEEGKLEQDELIKFEEEFFEFDAGPDFEEKKELDTTFKIDYNFQNSDVDNELAVDDPGCSSLRQRNFQQFLDNAKTEEEENLSAGAIFSLVFGFSFTEMDYEEIISNAKKTEEETLVTVSDIGKKTEEENLVTNSDSAQKEEEEHLSTVSDIGKKTEEENFVTNSDNAQKEEEEQLSTLSDIGKKTEEENLVTNSDNAQKEEKENLITVSDIGKKTEEENLNAVSDNLREKKEEESLNTEGFLRIGSRYVNLGHVTQEILRLTSNKNRHKITCDNGQWELLDFTDKGEITFVYLQCKECLEVIKFVTHPKNEDYVNPNYSYVLGCLTAGIGCSNAEEMRAAQGVPTMSAKTFRKYQENIYFDSLKVSRKSMEESAKKEAEIARNKGHVTETGIPYIAVQTDATWSKRSYKGGGLAALGCCAVVIGVETGEVIDIIIRTKVCAICDRAEREGREPKEHHCLKNYERTKSSSAMEKSALVEAFTTSIEKYGLIYNILIADGDSSVYKGILDANPYKNQDIMVKKYGCTCHISKNLCKALEKFAKKRDPQEIRGDGGLQARQLLERNILNIRHEILAAATRRRIEDIPMLEKTKLLCEDINNILSHVLGEHKECLRLNWPCGGKLKKGEENMIQLLKDGKKYIGIQRIILNMCTVAESLIKDGTTNQCECFNNHICKATGGKRTHIVGQKGYAARCNLQVLQSTNKAVLSTMYKELNKNVPEMITDMERNRQQQVIRNREYVKRKKNKSSDRKEQEDKDYGPNAFQPDVTKDIYAILCTQHFKMLKENQLEREEIFTQTIAQHKSKLWDDLRSIMITASRMYEICSKRDTTSCESTVKRIVHAQETSSVKNVTALQYGLENEKNAIEDLEKDLSIKIRKSGLFIDPEEEIFAASPDGLIDVPFSDLNFSNDIIQGATKGLLYSVIPGGIVEVKCPFSAEHLEIENAIEQLSHLRNVFDKNNRNHMNKRNKYYYQIQGQLHVSRREYCIFAMWSRLGIKKVIVMRDDHFWKDVMEFKLKRFYNDCLLPEIVDSCIKRNRKIREPNYIRKAKEEKSKSSASYEKQEDKLVEIIESELAQTDTTHNMDDEKIISNNESGKRGTKRKAKIQVDDDDVQITAVFEAPYKKEQYNNKLFDEIPIKEFQDTILKPKCLDTICINRFLNVMRRTFKSYEFLNVQHLLQQEHIRPFAGELCGGIDVQLIGGNESFHWRCLYFDGSELQILDSMKLQSIKNMPNEERTYIEKRYPNASKFNKIRIPHVTKQPDGNSCGIYAAANMVTILLGGKPWNIRHSKSALKMRLHYLKIIATEYVTTFPLEDTSFSYAT